ncbi:oxidoreductase [Apodospora peruviana]|uniref:Oxidoreductase n=1 Tax=Apodospora peruviana TaxID=516989 RepID=A0AAE0M759_9PEZI|nr:oxidoreductase [Apodospora peruviana]
MGTKSPTHVTSNTLTSKFLNGKVILITGGTSGLGAATAIALARRHPGAARIYISGRRAQAAELVTSQIRSFSESSLSEKVPAEKTEIIFLPCDLANLSSVRTAANHILSTESRLDILICNAGVAAVPFSLTKDGYEVQFGTNHLGHALLIRKLLPLLQKSAGRIISVTSFAHRFAVLPFPPGRKLFGDIIGHGQKGGGFWGNRWLRYAESKLANVLYTHELARRFPNVKSVSVTPGFVDTGMVHGMRFCDRVATRLLASVEWAFAGGRGMVTPEQGAENQVWAAMVDSRGLKNGGLYDSVGVLQQQANYANYAPRGEGGEEEAGDGDGECDDAPNMDLSERLWRWTEGEIAKWLL